MYQASLLTFGEPSIDPALSRRERHELGRGAWIDEVPGWVLGADDVFDMVRERAPWEARTRIMWGQRVDEPRLTSGSWADPPTALYEMSRALSEYYELELGAVSANFYRSGSDSVTWHGDTAGRYRARTVVAILSLGAPRRFLVRPRGGGVSRRFTPSHGDLLVMGGTSQHTFEHAVPKMSRAGPRISVMFREPGVF